MIRFCCILILVCLFTLFHISCEKSSDKETISEAKECHIDIDTLDFSFGVNYENVDAYLVPAEQSDLADSNLMEVTNALGVVSLNISGVIQVCHWVNQNFVFENAGGSMIGVPTVDELFQQKKYYGCHSAALLISSILRKFGFPAVMVEAAMVDWAYAYHNGTTTSFSGHVLNEIYVENKWILLDNNCTYITDYNPLNPYINTIDGDGYFVYAKGIDTWAYSNRDIGFTHSQMIYFSENVFCFEDLFDTVSYTWSY